MYKRILTAIAAALIAAALLASFGPAGIFAGITPEHIIARAE